jgi:hypothetical protein
VSDHDTNGILYYIGTQGKKTTWVNPMTSGFVNVTAEGNTAVNGALKDFVDRVASNLWLSCNNVGSYILDLGESRSAKVTDYTYRHFSQCLISFLILSSVLLSKRLDIFRI